MHQSVEIKTGDKFAIKLDSRSNMEIDREIDYLKKLNGTSLYLPQIIEYGRYSGVSYFVMTLLGKSLSDLKKKRNPQKFSLSTVLRASRQMLLALRDIHSKGIIHRDIKPANFVIGIRDIKRVYTIDFGLASEYNTGPERQNVGFRGTNTYASVRVHQYKDPGRVDDLVSWFYCTLRLLGMKFPWDKIKIPPKADRCSSGTINTLYSRLTKQQLQNDSEERGIQNGNGTHNGTNTHTNGNITASQPNHQTDHRTDHHSNPTNVTKEYKIAKLKKERKKIQDQFLIEKRKHPLGTLLKTAESKFKMPYETLKPITEHIDGLKFNEDPDYEMMDGCFQVALKDLNILMSDNYDWEKY